jgi:[ribosomal protein S5]-alanine N-acetyltransferase
MAQKSAPHPTLSTRRLRLRQFRSEDAEAMHRCFADSEAKRIETERAVRRFIDCTPSYYRYWAVADAKTDNCFGMVNYHDGHIRNKRVTIGYIIDPALQQKGFATEAVSAMINFCFGELHLHRVQAFIQPDNTASLKLVEKLGFRREGLLRDNLRVGQVWRDEILFALLEIDRRS